MPASPLAKFGPVFAELFSRTPAWRKPTATEPRPTLQLTIEEAFEHHPPGDETMARGCVAAAYLHLGQWDDAHRLAQHAPNRELDYWHAIAHRLEPDPANAGYWMSRVGAHPIHEALRREAATVAAMHPFNEWTQWQPTVFVDLWAESAATGSDLEQACLRVHEAECERLFAFCYEAALGA